MRKLAKSLDRFMIRKKFLFTSFIFLLTITIGSVNAQSGSEKEEESPFKNDPFFASPLEELLKKPDTDNNNDSAVVSQDNVKQYVGRLNENGIDYEGALESGPYNSNALYSVYPNMPMIHFNRVNSLFLGIRQERMQWFPNHDLLGIPNVHPHGMIGYSFGQKEWQYTVGLEKLIGRKRRIMVGAEYHKALATDDHWRVGLTETSLTSFFGGYDYLDYYKQQGWGAYLLLRSKRLFEGGIGYSDDRYSSLSKATDFALFGSGNRYRINPPVDIRNEVPVEEIELSNLTFSASFNPKRLVLARHFTLSLNAVWEMADPGIGSSEYSYDKYSSELISYINFEPGGIFKYRLKAGSITGESPFLKQFELGGIGTLRALPYKAMNGGNEMLLSNAEIHFGSPIYGKKGWVDFDDFYLSLFLDSGWVNYNSDLEDASGPFSGFDTFRFSDLRHNAGIGIGSSLIRCELAWDLNITSRAPVFWIRLNPTF